MGGAHYHVKARQATRRRDVGIAEYRPTRRVTRHGAHRRADSMTDAQRTSLLGGTILGSTFSSGWRRLTHRLNRYGGLLRGLFVLLRRYRLCRRRGLGRGCSCVSRQRRRRHGERFREKMFSRTSPLSSKKVSGEKKIQKKINATQRVFFNIFCNKTLTM